MLVVKNLLQQLGQGDNKELWVFAVIILRDSQRSI